MYTDLLLNAGHIRDRARAFVTDPLADVPDREPATVPWLYAPGQFELGRLHRLVREGFAANRFVHYAANYGALEPHLRLRRARGDAPATLALVSNGEVRLSVDGVPVEVTPGPVLRADLPAGEVLLVEVTCGPESPAAIGVLEEDLAGGWEVSRDGGGWSAASARLGTADLVPHLEREPTVALEVTRRPDGIYELEAPVLGRPVIRCAGVPRISTGESLEEALAAPEQQETRHAVVRGSDGTWTSEHELGFRYLAIHDAEVEHVAVVASAHAVPRRGAFVCSDERLSTIWATSAYTLRLCMHELMLDGIKRDRMPWIGDQALNTLANAYAFADASIARDSAAALGRPRHGYVNGISDYSLWWVVNSAFCARYFGRFSESEADHLQAFLEHLATYAGEDGLFRPRQEPDGFGDASHGSVFIDWGVTVAPGRPYTGLQMLWFWALSSGARLLRTAGHEGAGRWEALASDVRATLIDQAWDEDAQAWREYLGTAGTESPYPNFLAVLSGVHGDAVPDGVRNALLSSELPGTPFMASFALRGLAAAGAPGPAVSRISELWGAMLDAGAGTFWEEFAGGADPYSMYGRPFGKSLCHAWAAGPAALLPEIVLGIRPLEDGWARFEVSPSLGELDWAAAVVPVPGGEIVVAAGNGTVTVEVPSGTVLAGAGGDVAGPTRASWSIG